MTADIHALHSSPAPFADRIAAAGRGKVVTNFWMKPIPPREFDWCATFENDEPNDNGQMLHGYGATEAEAIEELLTNYEDGL